MNQDDLSMAKLQQDRMIQTQNSIIALGQSALKSAILINGGAAVALLAFIGNLWGKELKPEAVILLAISLKYYTYGVMVATLGTGTTFLTHFLYVAKHEKMAHSAQMLTIVLVAISYWLFYAATDGAYCYFVKSL